MNKGISLSVECNCIGLLSVEISAKLRDLMFFFIQKLAYLFKNSRNKTNKLGCSRMYSAIKLYPRDDKCLYAVELQSRSTVTN